MKCYPLLKNRLNPVTTLTIQHMKLQYLIFILFTSTVCWAQHEHQPEKSTGKWEHKPIFRQVFTDSSFVGKEIQVVQFTVPAGAVDPVAHVHDCELVGYILEGEVITKLKNKPAQHLRKGDVFYEFPNEVHESIQNPDSKKDAKILLYYLFNTGAVLYQKLDR